MIIALSILGLIALLVLAAVAGRKDFLDQEVVKLEKKMEALGAVFRSLSLSFEFAGKEGERFSKVLEIPMIVMGMDIGVDQDRSVAVLMQRDPDGRLRVIHESEDWRNYPCQDETDEHSF